MHEYYLEKINEGVLFQVLGIMSKKKKIVPKPATKKDTGLPAKAMAAPARASTEDICPKLSFRHTDPRRWTLADWRGEELSNLIRCFRKIEELTWAQIRTHKGLGYQEVNVYPAITHFQLSEEVQIHELKVCDEKRILGYRDRLDGAFCIIWFDRAHEICAEGKNARYK